jgi:hypothetical protein
METLEKLIDDLMDAVNDATDMTTGQVDGEFLRVCFLALLEGKIEILNNNS